MDLVEFNFHYSMVLFLNDSPDKDIITLKKSPCYSEITESGKGA
jgi:hypothetical protein